MARSRNIKPSFFTNDALAECHPLARLLFIGLWTVADRDGRLEDRPKKIRAEVLPYDDCDVDNLLKSLHQSGFIIRYAQNNSHYIQIVNFTKHQNPHIKEQASTIPAPDMHQTCTVLARPLTDSLLLIPDSLNPITEPIKVEHNDDFENWWKDYPHKIGKAFAKKAFASAIKIATYEELVEGVKRYIANKPPDINYCNPATWLNQERWKDEPARREQNENTSRNNANRFINNKPTWKSEGERLADKYAAEAERLEREEQAAALANDKPSLCITETIRENAS
jgi:hypothetical protein